MNHLAFRSALAKVLGPASQVANPGVSIYDSAKQQEKQMSNGKHSFRRGQRVRIAPEWRDPGDEKIEWVVQEVTGDRLLIEAQVDLRIKPTQRVLASMVEPIN